MYEIAQLKVYTLLRLLLMVEKVLPMIGPRIMRAAITTMATKTRIRAYSTKPWPFSFGANNILVDSPFLRIVLNISELNYYYSHPDIRSKEKPIQNCQDNVYHY